MTFVDSARLSGELALSPTSETVFQTMDCDLAAYLCARAYLVVKLIPFSRGPLFAFPADAASSAEAYYQGAAVPAKLILEAARYVQTLNQPTR
jgi:hypothetical protein